MAIGNTLGRTFNFPLPQQQEQQQPLLQGEQPQFVPQAELSGLQEVRGVTEDVYKKFYKLKNFASSMWKNYGIDVTSTDFTDEFSIKANQLYQESVADLKYTMDRLKNSQKMLESDASKANMRKAQGVDLQSKFYDEQVGQAFTQLNMTDSTKQVLGDYQKLITDRVATDEANKMLDNYKGQLQANIQEAAQQGRKDLVDLYTRDLQAVQGAIYDATKDKDRASLDAYRQEQVKKNQPDYTSLWELLNKTKQGDTSYVEGLTDTKGNPIVQDARINYTKGVLQGYFLTDSKGTRQWKEIPLDDVTGGLLQLINRFDPTFKNVGYDVLKNNMVKTKPKETEDPATVFQTDVAIKNQEALANSLSDPESMDYNRSIETLNEYAVNNQLIVPDYKGSIVDRSGKRFELEPGTQIVEVLKKRSGFWDWSDDPETFVIKVMTGNGGKEIAIRAKDNKEFINKLIENNEVQFQGAESAQPTEQYDLTPAQIKAQELIKKYGG